jgi:hypothetical protein
VLNELERSKVLVSTLLLLITRSIMGLQVRVH